MKRIAVFVFVVFLFLLTASCASAPSWSGAETEAGEFIWTQSPGIRFYFNLLVLAALMVLFALTIFKNLKEKGDLGLDHMGCLALIFLFVGFLLWKNVKQNIWSESFLINSEKIEVTYHPSIGETQKEIVEWKNIASCAYFSGQFDIQTWRMTVGRTEWQEGENRKGITLVDQNKKGVTLFVEKDAFKTTLTGNISEWIFGSDDFTFSLEEEKRLKTAINKYLPEEVKQKMSQETKEYLSKTE